MPLIHAFPPPQAAYNAFAVLQTGLWPLLIPVEEIRMRRIVIGVDGSETSMRGVEWVAEWAKPTAEIWLTFAAGPKPQLTPALRDAYEPVARELTVAHLTPADALLRGRGFKRLYKDVRYGDPTGILLQVAGEKQATAIVVGSSGRGRLASLLLGSVAQSIVAQARFTVIVVH
jgi:nucleotide-binding universal stress UspA family protein